MSKTAGRTGRWLLWWLCGCAALLLAYWPAAEHVWGVAGAFLEGIGRENPAAGDPDPAYEIYQRYRYAYDTYGYLFLSAKEGEDGQGKKEDTDGAGGGEKGVPPENAAEEAAGIKEAALPSFAQLEDYDYLMKHFYSVHPSTTAPRDLMKADRFLGRDLHLEKNPGLPQILIYHTHSQETYADYGPSHPEATVVEVGNYLTEILEGKGWNVIHDVSTYDIQGGSLDRNRAYTYALEGVERILREHPSIEVVLDLHRDGVRENVRLVSEVNQKPTANVMFFQGMSRTPEGEIDYLPNPNLEGNLAFAFQMQFVAAGDYPGLTRKIYLKGLRYNLHVRERAALIEVGAQTNTIEEARNAMEAVGEVLDRVLQGF